MIMVRLMGGLGNQMFQYAVGLQLATRHKTTLKLDLTYLLDRTLGDVTYRDFDLVIFNLQPEIANPAEVRRFRRLAEPAWRTFLERVADKFMKRHYNYYLERGPFFDARVLDLPDETYLEGYFQDERYFADMEVEIRKHFRLTPDESKLPAGTRRLADEIRASGGTCLHVRRGDYVIPGNIRHFGICGLDYYQRGLDKLRSMGTVRRVFVFSDDPVWCCENFKAADGFTVVGQDHVGPRASTHLWLMTLCRHFLIPNSSFAWWAAWLSENPNKIVIRPSRWLQSAKFKDVDICPSVWIKVCNE